MRCIDVNVLVYAHRRDLAEHEDYRQLLERLANDLEPLVVPDAVLSGFVRVITNRRVFAAPTSPAAAWGAVNALLSAPAVRVVTPGPRHWENFRSLAAGIDARGDDVADAYRAAYAVENNALWLSADRSFARFTNLRWHHPLGS